MHLWSPDQKDDLVSDGASVPAEPNRQNAEHMHDRVRTERTLFRVKIVTNFYEPGARRRHAALTDV